MATRDQLDGFKTEMMLRMEAVKNDLAPIKTGIYWLLGLVMSGVVMALLALVLRGSRP